MKNNQTPRQIWRNFLAEQSPELVAVAKTVARQMGGVNQNTLEELEAVNRASAGAAAGFIGFTYYDDTVAFWRKNRAKIIALMNEEAEAIGYESAFEMVRGFRSLEEATTDETARALYGRFNEDLTQIYNSFAWHALEAVAYRFGDYLYEADIDIYNIE